MNLQTLIDNIVRQTTVLIAQLATSGGMRAPLAQVADQVFLELARELEAQGLSRKVSADMFGLALRSYRRRIQRVQASNTVRGRSLWEAVLDYLSTDTLIPRGEVLRRFRQDDETSVRGVLHDLCESGVVLKLGSGSEVAYRAATAAELEALGSRGHGADELVWAIIYREGPLSKEQLGRLVHGKEPALGECVARLIERGAVELTASGQLASRSWALPVGVEAGWEAAFFDHFHALVKTLCMRLRQGQDPSGTIGGSTYSFDVWAGHPLQEEVLETLSQFRDRCSDLRRRVNELNAQVGKPDNFERVVVYAGQSRTDEELER